MFERFTERARRALFFSRYEASQLGSQSIETPHLLLGLIREGSGKAHSLLSHLPLDDIRKTLVDAVPFVKKLATSVEIPFSDDAKRALQHAVAEADALRHAHIGTEHLLLGLLREEGSVAGSVLHAHGATLEDARRSVAGLTPESGGAPPVPSSQEAVVYAVAGPGSDSLSAWVASIKQLVMELGSTAPDSEASRRLVEQIVAMLDSLKPPGRS